MNKVTHRTKQFILLSCFLSLLFIAPQYAFSSSLPSQIILMWQVQKDVPESDLKLFKELGVNALHSFQISKWSNDEIQSYFDKASKHNLNVIVFLGHFLSRSGNGEWSYNAECRAFINTWKGHSAIMAWHIADEPKEDGILKKSQKELYEFVKNADPSRPVMMSTNIVSQKDFEKYFTEDAFDILAIHKYVNPDVAEAQRKQIDNLKKNRTRSYPIIITFRAYNAPDSKIRRIPMTEDSLKSQYNFYIKNNAITNSFGFYGWDLSPNKGIKDVDYLYYQFVDLMKSRMKQ